MAYKTISIRYSNDNLSNHMWSINCHPTVVLSVPSGSGTPPWLPHPITWQTPLWLAIVTYPLLIYCHLQYIIRIPFWFSISYPLLIYYNLLDSPFQKTYPVALQEMLLERTPTIDSFDLGSPTASSLNPKELDFLEELGLGEDDDDNEGEGVTWFQYITHCL